MNRRGRWSAAEIVRLRALYGTRDEVSLARLLGRPIQSVRRMVGKWIGKRRKLATGPWDVAEVERLRRCLGVVPTSVIASIVGRTDVDVTAKVEELSRTIRAGTWTRQEIQAIKDLYGSRDDGTLAIVLGRTLEAVRQMAKQLRLGKDKAFLRRLARGAVGEKRPVAVPASRMPRWSEKEVAILVEKYPGRSNLQLAQLLGRSVKSVVSKAHDLDLKKSERRLRVMGRENVEQRYRPRTGRPAVEITMARTVEAPASAVAAAEPTPVAETPAIVNGAVAAPVLPTAQRI